MTVEFRSKQNVTFPADLNIGDCVVEIFGGENAAMFVSGLFSMECVQEFREPAERE
jgi:hypothetical protein